MRDLLVGGLPVVTLRADTDRGLVRADVAPGRGMMLLQTAAVHDGRTLDLLESPPLADVPRILDGGDADFAGNAAFSFGGAILLPYANRIRGRPAGQRTIDALVDGRHARLPMNWGGKAPGAEQYAMHGLVLDLAVADHDQPSPDVVHGRVRDHDFGGRWPSRADLDFTWRLAGGGLDLDVAVTNTGDEPLPLGVGWHPYFRIPSGVRAQARVHIPAARRLLVNDYDEVLPTGELADVRGTAHDVSQPDGLALGALHLDDCFVDLPAGRTAVEISDPASNLRIRLLADSPPVTAVQIYAPVDRPIVCAEPQFNWADPYAALWKGADTGMLRLAPGERAHYRVRTELAPLRTP